MTAAATGAAAAAAAAAATATTEKPVYGTAGRDPEQSPATAAATPLAGAVASGHGSRESGGAAVNRDGNALAPAAAASEDVGMEGSAKTRPLLRSKPPPDPFVTQAATGMPRPINAPVVAAAALPKTKADLPVPPAARESSQEEARQSPVPVASKAKELSESASATTTQEPKTIGGPLAPAAGDSLPPATETKAPPTAAALASPHHAAAPGASEKASSASAQEFREPSCEVSAAEASGKAETAGQADRPVASRAADVATSEVRDDSTPLTELAAAAAASDEARVESSRAAEGAVPVTAGGTGERRQSAPGGAVDTPTSLEGKVSTAELPIRTEVVRLVCLCP